MLAKKLSIYFFLSFFLCAFVGKICKFVFCKVTQNNIRYPKSLMINQFSWFAVLIQAFQLRLRLSPFWQITSGHFFARCAIFARHHFLCVSYLSISGVVFVLCHFRKVPLFSNGIKGCHFCWVYGMVVKL